MTLRAERDATHGPNHKKVLDNVSRSSLRAKRLIDEGSVTVASAQGEGTTFTFVFKREHCQD